jgi:Peptidase A4 family
MFSPVVASPEELQQYGFPPMPDKVNAPSAYNAWAKAVTAHQTRLQSLRLEQTAIFNGPAQIKSSTESKQLTEELASAPKNSTAISSSNWSGYVDYNNTTKPFAKSIIYAYWVVPVAQQAFGNTTGGWDYSSQWVGIDGLGSPDVLQAGTEADAYASGSTKSTFYAAWFEWYPFSETRISGFTVAPGDEMFVEVWNTSATAGNAYLLNLTTQQSYSVTFNAPSGTSLVGNSAEWIMERPGISGGLATLTNYVACPFDSCYAFGSVNGGTYNSLNYPGITLAGTTAYDISMLDNNGLVISVGTLIGPAAGTTLTDIWFRDTGSAY